MLSQWKVQGDYMIKNKKINTLVFMAFILGLIIALQIKSFNGNNGLVTLKSIMEIENQIELEKNEIGNLKKLILQRTIELNKYETELKDSGSILNSLKENRDLLRISAGVVPLFGQGIRIELRDGDRELKEGENPNSIIVHDQDVLNIVNDLKIAGAEAISINGQRLSNLSEIKCSGPTITINGRTYGQPFIIEAIGFIDDLIQTTTGVGSYSYLLTTVYGIDVRIYEEDYIEIPGFELKRDLQYLGEGD